MLTISQFSSRTGISASALRFYERKGLLAPRRLANGYRAYGPEQVDEAKLINSLREVGVSVADIRHFLGQDQERRRQLLAQWHLDAEERLAALRVATQYLRGLSPEEPQIHLHRWEEPSVLLWFPASGPIEPLPFGPTMAACSRQLERLSISVLSGGYVRTVDRTENRLTGEVGFRIKAGRRRGLPPEARLQELPPALFATLECTLDDEKSAHRVFRWIDHFGLAPSGLYLERYLPGAADRYELMLGVRERVGNPTPAGNVP